MPSSAWTASRRNSAQAGGSGEPPPLVASTAKWVLEIVSRPPGSAGFVLLKWRWIVEWTIGLLNLPRRLSKDYEVLPASSEAFTRLTMISIMLARLAHQA